VPLHGQSYLHVGEVRATPMAFGGLSQERRYIAGKLEVSPQRAAA
jgi:4-oxalocrotonate tautomerase